MLDTSEASLGLFSVLIFLPKFTLTLIEGGLGNVSFVSTLGFEEGGNYDGGGLINESPEPTFCFEFGAVVSSEEAFGSKVDIDLPRGFYLLSL